MKQDLIELFHKFKAIEKGHFTLASGQTSDHYINCKKVTLNHQALQLICRWFWTLASKPFNAVGCIETGANHLMGGILATSIHLNGFFLRKETKDHGNQQLHEGILEPGMKVILIEDVITTGGSIAKVVDYVTKMNATVEAVIAVVDRSHGKAAIDFQAMLTIDDLLGFQPKQ